MVLLHEMSSRNAPEAMRGVLALLDILDLLKAAPRGLPVDEVAEGAGVSKAFASEILKALVGRKLVESERYRLRRQATGGPAGEQLFIS